MQKAALRRLAGRNGPVSGRMGYTGAMTWLLAVIFRPVGMLLFFGGSLAISRLLWPLFPAGRVRTLLYDRTLQKRYPWRVFFLFFVAFYGTIGLVAYFVT